MSDLEIDKTMGIARKDILTQILLTRHYNTIEAFEKYNRIEYLGGQGDISILKQKLDSLFMTMSSALKKSLKPEDFKLLSDLMTSEKYQDLLKAFDILNDWLYEKKITMIDDRKVINRLDIELNNYEKGKK